MLWGLLVGLLGLLVLPGVHVVVDLMLDGWARRKALGLAGIVVVNRKGRSGERAHPERNDGGKQIGLGHDGISSCWLDRLFDRIGLVVLAGEI
jgi:hypothetical protein